MEIYLTKMILNPLSRRVHTEVGNPQELHKTISRAFPAIENQENLKKHEQTTPRNKYNILHRLDIDRNRGTAFLLVQSVHEPDWSFLNGEFADEIETKNVSQNYQAIENGMNLIFRLQANPTRRAGNDYEYPDEKKRVEFNEKFKHPKKRRRIPIYKEEDQIKWLVRQGEQFGFQVANLKIEPAVRNLMSAREEKISFKKSGEKEQVTYGSVVFEGVLQVTNTDDFKKGLITGIGQGKAYGFGLLSIAKVQNV